MSAIPRKCLIGTRIVSTCARRARGTGQNRIVQPIASEQRTESRAAKTIRDIFESGRPVTVFRSAEEQRVAKALREVGSRLAHELLFRSGRGRSPKVCVAERITHTRYPHRPRSIGFHCRAYRTGHISPQGLSRVLARSPETRRRLRDIYESCLDQKKFVVISSPIRFIPEEIERSIIYIELRPPDLVELLDLLREESRRALGPGEIAPDDALLQQLARTLQGLTLDEARYGIRRALAGEGRLGPQSVPALLEEKRLLINRSGVIEYISDTGNFDSIGGLENLKKWLLERRRLFQMRDSVSSEIVPKGVLFMGIPGCGKSLSVKAISSYFDLPLYRVDMIEIFSGRHGKPEGAFVEACRMLEDMAPAVLWFDEIEMGITSTESGGEQGRIFAFFLTWMQEKTRGLFVAATANRIDLLPAEMIRKGRFDEVFFVDLPLDEERLEILRFISTGVELTRRRSTSSN